MATLTTKYLASFPIKSGDFDEFVTTAIGLTVIPDYDAESDWFDAIRPADHGQFAVDDQGAAIDWLVNRGCDPAAARELVTCAAAERRTFGWNPVTGF